MASLTFTNPEFLFFLLAIPIIVITHILLYTATKRKGMVFSNFDTLKRVTGKNVMTRNWTMLAIRIVALCFLIIALAGPIVWYEGLEQDTDYVIAIDTSASMTADDFVPTRLDAAKAVATAFVDQQETITKIGVMGFAGIVTVEEPLTDDLEAVRQAIRRIQIKTIAGTDVSGALVTGTNLLLASEKGKALILLTDGSATVASFRDDPVVRGTAYAKKHGVVVHTIGIGRPGTVPTGYLPQLYNVSAVYDPQTLKYISNQTGGRAMTAEDALELATVFDSLRGNSESTMQQYPAALWFMMVGMILLMLEWGLVNTRYRLIP